MKHKPCSVAGLLLLVVLVLTAAPHAADANSPGDWQSSLMTWRAQHAKDLQAPYGWLSLIGLEWLKPGDNSVGWSADNTIILHSKLVPYLGVVRLGENFIELRPGEMGYPNGLLVDGKAPQNPQPLVSDSSGKPSKITITSLLVTVIHRGDRYALRIKDSNAPARTQFHGLRWYPPNTALRVKARWVPYDPPQKKKIPTVLGTETEAVVPGRAEFTLDRQTLSLEPILESPDDKELFFVLRDTTSKTETYGAGRFLYTEFPDQGLAKPGELWLDFNRLENPPCAYTPYATCPVPPPQNRLQVALPVGEMRYHN